MGRLESVISIAGAREHNLRNVSLTLPKNKLICFTGVSGSGKSSLAFDTLYAEGQRRYIESLSSYARQFMGELPKPDVDQITGLAPSISIQQKTSGWNPRSTVGTITQILDYLRVLYARAGTPYCTRCDRPISAQTREQMLGRIFALPEGTRFMLLAPKVRGQKGEHRDLFDELQRQGFVRARIDGVVFELSKAPPLDRYRRHDIEVVVDRLIVRPQSRSRIAEALETALSAGNGTAIVARGPEDSLESAPSDASGHAGVPPEAPAARRGRARRSADHASRRSTHDDTEMAADAGLDADADAVGPARRRSEFSDTLLSAGFACGVCGLSFEPPQPNLFSFNSPQGMCPQCDGLGRRFDFDERLLIPDPNKRFCDPCIVPFRHAPGRWRRHIYEGVARHIGFDLDTPWRELPPAARKALLHGTGDAHVMFEWKGRFGTWRHGGPFEGAIAELQERHRKATSSLVRRFYEQYMRETECPACRGARLNPAALAIRLDGALAGKPRRLNLYEMCELSIRETLGFLDSLELSPIAQQIAVEPLKETRARLRFLLDVGLDYLTLGRSAPTLSGGESQRIRLASQIGCGLVGVLYVLDEPSIGLHPRDNRRLLAALQRLRDMGNTVVVVEHDRDTMEAADLIVDFGPGAGARGGEVVARGGIDEIRGAERSLSGAYLSGRRAIETPVVRRPVSPRPKASSKSIRKAARAGKSDPQRI
ncbi:MAG: excinuclease ABC subunit UvrA [Phycisphaerae bacterium]